MADSSNKALCFCCQVEEAQGREAPIQRLADLIAGPFVYTIMTLSAATFAFWYVFVSLIAFSCD